MAQATNASTYQTICVSTLRHSAAPAYLGPRGADLEIGRVDEPDRLRQASHRQSWDAIVCDRAMPGLSGLEAIDVVKQAGLDAAFATVTLPQ